VSDLPPGWAESPIGSLCSLNNVRAFKPTEWATDGLPIVRIQNLNNPEAPFNHFRGEFENRYHLSGGELLFAWSGTPGTSFGAHVWRGGEAVLSQHIFRVNFDEATLDKRFFRYAINQKLDELSDIAHGGVGLRHVTKGTFERTLVAVPPLNEQKHIADKLDAVLARVDACRERLNRVPAILKRIRQAVLDAATSGTLREDLVSACTSSGGSDSVQLAEVLSEVVTGPFGSSLHKADSVIGGIPVVNPMHINGGVITPSSEMTVSPQKAQQLSDFALRAGDVVIARREVMGRCAVVQPYQEGWLCGTGSMILRGIPSLIPEYLQLCLSSPATVQALETDAVGSTMVNLNQRIMLSLQFQLPSASAQREIVRRVEALFVYADRIEARYTAACAQVERLTPALLAKAFRGELVSQDPNDEPASVLLERIRVARAAGETAGPKRRTGSGRPKTPQKTEVLMLTRNDIQDTHLTMILKDRGPLTAEALWSASELDIDDFYDQLKDEEARGLLQEKRGDSSNAPRMLEAA
jgi:type I restriction enzyme S subunit